jgi:hypothetical protein
MTRSGTSSSLFVYLILIIFLVCVEEAAAFLVSDSSTYAQLLLQESIE